MVGTTCCVPGCQSNSLKNKGLSFHRFPTKNLSLRRLWIIACTKNTVCDKSRGFSPTIYSKVCGKHFVNGKKACNDRVPSIFINKKETAKCRLLFSPMQNPETNVPVCTILSPLGHSQGFSTPKQFVDGSESLTSFTAPVTSVPTLETMCTFTDFETIDVKPLNILGNSDVNSFEDIPVIAGPKSSIDTLDSTLLSPKKEIMDLEEDIPESSENQFQWSRNHSMCISEDKLERAVHESSENQSNSSTSYSNCLSDSKTLKMTGRYCCVNGCKNSQIKLRKWKGEACSTHEEMLQKDCPCLIPFRLHFFPSDLDMKQKWILALNKEDFTPGKTASVCSIHFADGLPTPDNPIPQLLMGSPPKLPSALPKRRALKRGIDSNQNDEPNFKKAESAATSSLSIPPAGFVTSSLEELQKALGLPGVLTNQNFTGTINYTIRKQPPKKSIECQTDPIVEIAPSQEDISKDHMYSRQPVFSKNSNLAKNIKSKFIQTDIPTFTANDMDEASCKFYTGLNINVFWKLVENLTPLGNFKFSLSVEDQILIIFMRLRLGLLYEDLGRRFNVSTSLISRMFNSWMPVMATYMNDLVSFLPRETIKESLPKDFKGCFPNTTCIVDCFEMMLQHTFLTRGKAQPNLNPKEKETAKFLTAIAPHGYIMFVSKCYDGTSTDAFIAKDCGFLDHILPGDEIIADLNLDLESEIYARQAVVNNPDYVRGKMQITDVDETTSAASNRNKHTRLQVEGAISRLKGFHVLKNTTFYKTDNKNLNHILVVVAALCNLQLAIMNFFSKQNV